MVEVARPTTHTENQRAPENPISYTPLLGLQGRLAMGGAALFPSIPVELTQGINQESIPATIALLDKASVKERKSHWATQPEQSKDAQLSKWKNSVVTKINLIPTSTLGKEHANFFERIGIDVVHFNEEDAQHLYDKYFSKTGVGIGHFAADVVEAFAPSGDNLVADLKSHLAAIKWMAGMFGGNSAEIITQLIDAKIDSLSPDTFVAARKDKVNNLSEHENDLLTFLTEGETVPTRPPEAHANNPDDEAPNQPDISLLDLQELKNNNLTASSHFIEVVRDGLHQGGNPNYLENKFGMPIEKNTEYFDASMFTVKMGDLYNLPLGMMVRGAHAFLITNGPHERAGKWYLSVWNPFGQGGTGKAETEEVELHGDYSTPDLFTANIQNEAHVGTGAPNFIVNEQWFGEYKKDPQLVNLEALLDQPEFAGIRDELRELKFSALQKDDKNCVPLCGYLDSMLHRLSDTSPFVSSGGIEKFEKDFGIHIKSKVELNPIPAGGSQPLSNPEPSLVSNPSEIILDQEIESKRTTQAYGEKVQGASHIRKGTPCQDAIRIENDPAHGALSVAVADGHGSEKHVRSEKGAQLAVEVLNDQFFEIRRILREKGMGKAEEYIREQLAKKISENWNTRVYRDISSNPFSPEEQKVANLTSSSQKELFPYGSTLLGAMMMGDELLLVQIGDGNILVTDDQGVISPIPHDPSLLGNETFSLCLKDAIDNINVMTVNTSSFRNPMISVTTDGISNSYAGDDDFHQLMTGLYPMSDDDVKSNLSNWLNEISKGGSGDDIALGILRIKNTPLGS